MRRLARTCTIRRPRILRGWPLLVVSALLVLPNVAQAAGIHLNTPFASNGTVGVPVWLAPGSGENVASLQFRLHFDSRQFSIAHVDIGAAASQAGKDVVFAEHGDSTTIIIAGLNQQAIDRGLVATVYLSPLGSSTYPDDLSITSPVFSDPEGVAIALNEATVPDATDSDPEPSPGASGTGSETPPTTDSGPPAADKSNDTPTAGNANPLSRNYGAPYNGGSSSPSSGNGRDTSTGAEAGTGNSVPGAAPGNATGAAGAPGAVVASASGGANYSPYVPGRPAEYVAPNLKRANARPPARPATASNATGAPPGTATDTGAAGRTQVAMQFPTAQPSAGDAAERKQDAVQKASASKSMTTRGGNGVYLGVVLTLAGGGWFYWRHATRARR